MTNDVIEVPWQQLDSETLTNLVTEYVTRDGTDYGWQEVATEAKVEQVIAGLKNKQYVIVFDTGTEQSNIVPYEDWRRWPG